MLDVYLTVDVEIWCDGWSNIDDKFPQAFDKYIYGRTPRGMYGLPFQLAMLQEHGLLAVFFVEPLFSARFGVEPLAEIVALIKEHSQEIQLHLHTEWVDEARIPLLPNVRTKRQHLRYFNQQEQAVLIAAGADLLRQAGQHAISAFRAGSFGFNVDTLYALATNRIPFDSSYNATLFGKDSGLMPGTTLVEPVQYESVCEYPMMVFKDGLGKLRHAQLTACSFKEMECLLWKALDAERTAFVILSHNFELLNPSKNRPDDVVVKRFSQLCDFLSRNRDCFNARGFEGLQPKLSTSQPDPLTASFWQTGTRVLEQAYRRKFA